jgi:N-methylhydantoinase B
MEVGAAEGHEFDLQAMFDRVDYAARGRRGGGAGAATTIALDDGTAMKGKGKQFVPHGRKVLMAFPGGAGYGVPSERSVGDIKRDLALGYVSAASAKADYGLSDDLIHGVLALAAQGELSP